MRRRQSLWKCTHTCFVLLASRAGLLERLAPATLLLIAGRSSRGRSNSSLRNRGKPLYLEDDNILLFKHSFYLSSDSNRLEGFKY